LVPQPEQGPDVSVIDGAGKLHLEADDAGVPLDDEITSRRPSFSRRW
jgi:hypothetical protein